MNPAPLHLLVTAVLGTTVAAQAPAKTPPWWGVHDEVTVSLYWDFSAPFPAGQPTLAPTLQVVPTWYNNPAPVTAWTAPASIVWIASLNGHTGVLGINGTGAPQTALLKLKVDNDPHLDWVKIFQFQFDSFEGASGSIKKAIEQDLAQYKRTIVSETSTSLGNGWSQVTLEAQLIPQPGDETVSWTFTENALGTVAIDNLFVSSKCVKPEPDETGDAMGMVESSFDTSSLSGLDITGVAVTESSTLPVTTTYWLSVRSALATAFHTVLRVDNSGPVPIVSGTTVLPDTATLAPNGPMDLSVETVNLPGGGFQQFVYALIDQRPSNGPLLVRRLNATTGALSGAATALTLPSSLQNLGVNQSMGLAFDPSGNGGAGSHWISATDQNGNGLLVEFSRAGQPLSVQGTVTPLPTFCAGLGYDDTLGNFYLFSQTAQASPNGPVQANGFEVSAYDFKPTGNRFCGDLTIPNAAGGPRGGRALALEVYRSRRAATSELRIVTLVETNGPGGSQQHVRELAGPFGFGWSQFGRVRMRGGVPFLGSNTFQVALTGVPDALFGMLYLGFSNTTYNGLPLPLPLSSLGMPESTLSISLDVSDILRPPTTTGEFVVPVNIPSTTLLGYAPVFFQWILLDPNVPGFLAASQAGKTVLYP